MDQETLSVEELRSLRVVDLKEKLTGLGLATAGKQSIQDQALFKTAKYFTRTFVKIWRSE